MWQKYLFSIDKDVMPRVSFYTKRSADRWPSNLGWVWHIKVFGGWFVGIGKIAEDIDGFMKMVPCRGVSTFFLGKTILELTRLSRAT